MFDIAMADGDPDTSTYLRPTSADVHNRSAMFGLSAAVAHQLRGKPGTCITYLLRGPGMVKLMHDAIDSTKRAISEDVLNREFRRYMGPGRKEDALGWSRLASAALIGEYTSNPPNRLIRYGTIGLNQNGSKLLTSFKTAFRTIGNQGNEGSPYPAAAFSLVNLSGSGTKTLASIYNILGLMAKLLALTEKSSWNTSNEVQKEQDILDLLFGFFPNTNSVALPVWVKSQGVGSESDDEDNNGRQFPIANPMSENSRKEMVDVHSKATANPKAFEVYWQWQSDKGLWKKSEELIEVKSDFLQASHYLLLQQSLMQEVANRGVVIETLPSSNVRVSQYKHFSEHHALRWMKAPSAAQPNDPDILVSLGSDDPGIFSTDIETEFHHLFIALKNSNLTEAEALQRVAQVNERGRIYRFHPK